MADYQFNTDLSPKVQGTNLGDMLNMARGVQQYQQAEEVNPYLAQKAKEEATQAKTTTRKGILGLDAEQAKMINEHIGSVLNDERIKHQDPQRRASPLVEAKQRVINSGVDPVKAEILFAPFIDKALRDKDPNAVNDMISGIKNVQRSGIGALEQRKLGIGQTVKIGGVDYQYSPDSGELQQVGATGGAAAPSTQGQPKGNELFREDMPIVPGAVMQLNERQKTRYDEGEKIFAQSTEAMRQANEMTQSIRKIEQTIGSAAGSKPGQLVRDAIKGVMGDAQLETLTKNLEDLYVRNTAAMGGDTDTARESIKKISGSPDMTVEALQGIIDRVKASSHELKKFNQGFDNYAKNTSTENANVHARQYRNAWIQNADPLVFMAQTINASKKSPAEKEMMRQKLLKDLTDDEIDDLSKKAANIKLLEAGQRVKENK